jgi:hypothetical protein
MTFWKWLSLALVAAVYWWLMSDADKVTQAVIVLGAVMVYLFYELSKQISEHHKKVAYMLENIHRAQAGYPRADDD